MLNNEMAHGWLMYIYTFVFLCFESYCTYKEYKKKMLKSPYGIFTLIMLFIVCVVFLFQSYNVIRYLLNSGTLDVFYTTM